MKLFDLERFPFRAVTSLVLTAFVVSASMVTLGASGKAAGEITVFGVGVEGATVTVNGEAAKTGRTIFSSSTISTPEGVSAVLNLGKAGKIQIAPGSTFAVDVDSGSVSGNLTAGSITVLGSAQPVRVKTLAGQPVSLAAGETASASSSSAAKAQKGPGGLDWWVWAAIVGGAVAAVVLVVALTGDDNRVTSPVR